MDLNEYFIMLAIQAGIGWILTTVKNPNSQRAALLRESLLHLADAINAAFRQPPFPNPPNPPLP